MTEENKNQEDPIKKDNQMNQDIYQEEDDDQVEGQEIEVIEADYDPNEDPESALVDDMIEIGMDDFDDEDGNEEDEDDGQDDSIETIDKHQGAVFCIDSYKNLIATGGEDDQSFVFSYDAETQKLDQLLETEKFKDSVTNVKFSCDGKYVAMCDMSGLIRVYTLDTKSLHWTHDIESDIESLGWHPSCNVLFCSTSDGYFYMFKLSTSEIKIMYSGDLVGLGCFKILKDGKRAVCCYNNGTIRFWDLKTGQTIHNFPNSHTGDIISIDVSPDGNLVATGGADMKIHLINTVTGKFIVDLSCGETNKPIKREEEGGDENMEDGQENSIESISFCKTLPLVACATLSGKIFVWDLNMQSLRCNHDNQHVGYTKLVWNNQETLYASTLSGSLQVYDGRNLELIKNLKGHKSEILDFCFNDNLTVLYTASNDNMVKLFKLN